MRFMFLEKQPKLLLAILMGTVATNINGAIVHISLSIDNWVWNKKQKIIKSM